MRYSGMIAITSSISAGYDSITIASSISASCSSITSTTSNSNKQITCTTV